LTNVILELHYVFYVQQLGHVRAYVRCNSHSTTYFFVNCADEAMSRLRARILKHPHLAERLFFVDAVVADVFSKLVHLDSVKTRSNLRDYV
jgi:hypothetical protein